VLEVYRNQGRFQKKRQRVRKEMKKQQEVEVEQKLNELQEIPHLLDMPQQETQSKSSPTTNVQQMTWLPRVLPNIWPLRFSNA